MADPVPHRDQFVERQSFLLSENAIRWLEGWWRILSGLESGVRAGKGSPAGVVAAPVGTLYRQLDGAPGSTLWVKEAGGTTTAGWAAK